MLRANATNRFRNPSTGPSTLLGPALIPELRGSEQRRQPFRLLQLPTLVARLTAFRTIERGRLPLVTAHRTAPTKKRWVGQVHLVRVNPVLSRVILDSEKRMVRDFFWWDDSGASGFTVIE